MKKFLAIWIVLLSLGVHAQVNVDLKIRKNLRDQLDELIFQYEQLSRFSSIDEINGFRRLFAEDALIFDYLTPNYITRNTGTEVVKEFDDFLTDVRHDFPQGLLQSRIIDTNLGEAIDYKTIDWANPSVNVTIHLKTVAPYVDGGQFTNDAELVLNIVFDTLSDNVRSFKIRNINKVSSRLIYEQEEKRPAFEKMGIAKTFQSWNDVFVEDSEGDFYSSNPITSPRFSQSYGIQFIKILSAPEPEEFAYTLGINYTLSEYRIESNLYSYTSWGQDINGNGVWKSTRGEGLAENVTSELFELPLEFRYERKFNRQLSVFGNVGMALTYQFRATHSGEGLFSYVENDPRLNQPIFDAPELGYVRDTTRVGQFTRVSGSLSRDNFGLQGTASAGLNFENKAGWVFYIGVTGFKGVVNNRRLIDFSYSSTSLQEYNGLFPMLNSFNFGGYGAFFGIRKRFRSRNGLVKMAVN